MAMTTTQYLSMRLKIDASLGYIPVKFKNLSFELRAITEFTYPRTS